MIELRNGYIWRQQQKENTLAALVTLPIANYAGKVSKENLTLKDIFNDGRFDRRVEFTADDEAIIEEIYK